MRDLDRVVRGFPSRVKADRAGTLAADSLWTFAAFVAAVLAGTIGGIVLARTLGVVGRGSFEFARTIAFVSALPAGLGLGRATIYFLPRRELTREELVGAVAAAAVPGAFVAVVVGAALAASTPWHSLGSADIALAASSIPLVAVYLEGQSALWAVGESAWYRRTLAGRDVVFLVVLGLAVAYEVSVTAALAAWVAHWLVSAGLVLGLLARACGRIRVPSQAALCRLVVFGASQALLVLLQQAHLRGDILLLEGLRGTDDVGEYAVAANIAELVVFSGIAVGIALFPRTAAESAGEASGGATTTAAALRSVAAFALAAAIALALTGPVLIEVLVGSEFAPAAEPLRVLLPGAVAMAVFSVLLNDLTGRGRVVPVALVVALSLAANVGLNLLLIPPLGATGAALSSSLTYPLAAVSLLVVFTRGTSSRLADCLVLKRADLEAALRLIR